MRITSEFVLTLLKNKDKIKFVYKVETFMDLKVNYQILKHINNPQPCMNHSSSRCLRSFSWNVYTRIH